MASALIAAALGIVVARSSDQELYLMPGDLGLVAVVPSAPLLREFSADGSRRGFLTRDIGLRTPAEVEWGRRNALTPAPPFMHNLRRVFVPGLYDQSPEYFPLADGKRVRPAPDAENWNPDLGRIDTATFAAQRAAEHFARHPEQESFSLGVNDGLLFGESAETLALVLPPKWFRGRPDYSSLVFTFMNRAAGELAKSHPDKYLGCLAYYWCENAPPFPIDRHVIPFLTADRSQSYDSAFVREEFDLQRRWAQAMGMGKEKRDTFRPASGLQPSTFTFQPAEAPPRLGLYDYLDGQGFLVPRLPIQSFARHVRHAWECGFTDYYAESSRNWGLDGPMPWVIARLLSDPQQDGNRLLDTYYAEYFGSAAAPMRRFFERCEEQWMQQAGPSYWLKHYRNESQAVLFPADVCRELRGYLSDAAALARRRDSGRWSFVPGLLSREALVPTRVQFVSDSFGVTERFVAFQNARHRLAGAALSQSSSYELLNEYLRARSEFVRYTHQTTDRWPLSFFPIKYDDWVRNDPAFAAALQVRSSAPTSSLPPVHQAGVSDFPAVAAAFSAADSLRRGAAREVLPNGGFEGAILPGRRVAGLPYGIDLPSPWQSRVEPTETFSALVRPVVTAPGSQQKPSRSLRISGAENATIYQWVPATPGRVYAASVRVKGVVTNSDAVMLTLSWLDSQLRPIGNPTVMRLPDGDWEKWVKLEQGGLAPPTAKWIGVGIRIMHQVRGDWAEVRDFSLLECR